MERKKSSSFLMIRQFCKLEQDTLKVRLLQVLGSARAPWLFECQRDGSQMGSSGEEKEGSYLKTAEEGFNIASFLKEML